MTDCSFTLLIFSVNYVNYCQMNAALLLFPSNRYSVEQLLWEDRAIQLFNFKHKHSNNITNILFLVYLLFFLHLFCVECKLDPNFALWSHPNYLDFFAKSWNISAKSINIINWFSARSHDCSFTIKHKKPWSWLWHGCKKIEICQKRHLIFQINLDMHIADKITNNFDV